MDSDNAEVETFAGTPKPNFLAIKIDLARVRTNRAGKYFGEAGLAGSVRPDKSVHLSSHQSEVDRIDRDHAGVRLTNPSRSQQGPSQIDHVSMTVHLASPIEIARLPRCTDESCSILEW